MRYLRYPLACLALPLLAAAALADDWPQWLGPQRDGVWRETGLAENVRWQEEEAHENRRRESKTREAV